MSCVFPAPGLLCFRPSVPGGGVARKHHLVDTFCLTQTTTGMFQRFFLLSRPFWKGLLMRGDVSEYIHAVKIPFAGTYFLGAVLGPCLLSVFLFVCISTFPKVIASTCDDLNVTWRKEYYGGW